jgi:hypothetical protein
MRVLIAIALDGVLSACNRPAAEAPAANAPAAVAAVDQPAPAVDPDCTFCADPATVRTCDVASGVRTTLHWNIANPAISLVGIYVVDDAGKDSPFAEQPSKGSIQTGPWLKPGLTFKLKDPAGNVLQTVVIKGKDC